MIPDFIDTNTDFDFKILPEGIWKTTLEHIKLKLLFSERRIELFDGLMLCLIDLKEVGCKTVFIDGSFVTNKEDPTDIDVAYSPFGGFSWDKLSELHPVFLKSRDERKRKYNCDIFDAYSEADNNQTIFRDFYQKIEGIKNIKKGILKINL